MNVDDVGQLLIALACDPKQHRAFEDAPESVLADTNLQTAERELLLRRDGRALASALAQDEPGIGVAFGDPGPDPMFDPDPLPVPRDPFQPRNP